MAEKQAPLCGEGEQGTQLEQESHCTTWIPVSCEFCPLPWRKVTSLMALGWGAAESYLCHALGSASAGSLPQ